MEKSSNNANAAPIILGFTPINKPSKHNPGQLDLEAPPSIEPPRKQRRKDKLESLPSPPNTTTKPRRKTSSKKDETAKAKRTQKVKAVASKQSATPAMTKESSTLAEKTKSKLHAFRYSALPTSAASTTDLYTSGKEVPPPDSRRKVEPIELHPDMNEQSDSTLSSDLWRSQLPLPEYPWLYASPPKANNSVEQVASASDCQSERSVSLAQLLRPDTQIQSTLADDNLINDEELEKLLDGVAGGDGLDDMVIKDSMPNIAQKSPEISDILERNSDIWEDDFPLDEDALQILYESTCSSDPITKAANVAAEKTLVQDATTQQQPQAFSYQHMNSCPEQPIKPIKTTHIPEENFDFDEPEFEDMINLLAGLPGTPMSNHIESEDCHTLDEDLVPSPATSMHTIQSSPLKSTQPKQDIHNRFVRPPHPPAVQIPSPIQGLSHENRVLTCFRIGEAVNATARAQREGCKVFIELYARVLHSVRAGPVQTFRIVDLWSDPNKLGIVLEGRWVGWEKSELLKKDGEIFWEEGLRRAASHLDDKANRYARKCRLIGSLERKASGGYLVNILNLWEAAWDDIAFAKRLIFEPSELE